MIGYKGTIKFKIGYISTPNTGKKLVLPPKKPINMARKKYKICFCLILCKKMESNKNQKCQL